jgi:hypothetical protein
MDTGEKVAIGVCASLVVVGTGFVADFIRKTLRNRYFDDVISGLASNKDDLYQLNRDIRNDAGFRKSYPDLKPDKFSELLAERIAERSPPPKYTSEDDYDLNGPDRPNIFGGNRRLR